MLMKKGIKGKLRRRNNIGEGFMQKLMSYIRCAMQRYNMVDEGDRVAVGLSGGKDSVAMLVALAKMRDFYPKRFDLVAISLDPCFDNVENDYSKILELCDLIDVELVIKRTHLWDTIFNQRNEKNPCSLCARMRRGALHNISKEMGCNKVALGHHMDDVAETFMMNLLNGGSIGSFGPVAYLSRKDITLIRPMIFARGIDCARAAHKNNLPIVESRCPVDGKTEREKTKLLLNSMEKKHGNVRNMILSAMQKGEISGY